MGTPVCPTRGERNEMWWAGTAGVAMSGSTDKSVCATSESMRRDPPAGRSLSGLRVNKLRPYKTTTLEGCASFLKTGGR